MQVYFVEADEVKGATGVDAVGADAEDVRLLQATLSVNNTNCHGGWKSRWHHDCNQVKATHQHKVPRKTFGYL